MAESVVPKLKLNDGSSIPMLGLGTWQAPLGEVEQVVKDAIDMGYRHFDCALAYGNEKEVGRAIIAKIKEGVVKREDLYVVSKLWQTYHHPDNVEIGIRRSLQNFGLNYLDLYLIHFPIGFLDGENLFPKDEQGKFIYSNVDYVDTWLAMEKLVKKGLTKSIGISNFNHHQIERILNVATIKPVTNQVECHPYLSQKKLGDWMAKHEITLTAYSPLGSPERPSVKPEDRNLMADPRLSILAQKYNKSPAQILLRYHIERGFIVVPKTVSKERLRQNFDIFDFKITNEDMETLMSFECNGRFFIADIFGADHKDYPFKADF